MKEKIKFVFIIGQPRSGTTALCTLMEQHPNIFLPKIKEPHYFIDEKDIKFLFNSKGKQVKFNKLGFINNKKDYFRNYNFFKEKNSTVFIDGSTLYSVHLDSIKNIIEFDWIEPYFIYIKRNSVDRVISHYIYSISRFEEFRSFEDCLKDELENKYPNWLINGYLKGSNHEIVEDFFSKNKNIPFLSIDNSTTSDFTTELLSDICLFLKIESYTFEVQKRTNELFIPKSSVIQNIRKLGIKIRRINPFIFDNRFTRYLYNKIKSNQKSKNSINEQFDINNMKITFQKYKKKYDEIFNVYR